jgi:hypothetical protein
VLRRVRLAAAARLRAVWDAGDEALYRLPEPFDHVQIVSALIEDDDIGLPYLRQQRTLADRDRAVAAAAPHECWHPNLAEAVRHVEGDEPLKRCLPSRRPVVPELIARQYRERVVRFTVAL